MYDTGTEYMGRWRKQDEQVQIEDTTEDEEMDNRQSINQ